MTTSSSLVGLRLSERYTIDSKVGAGNFSDVYAATDETTGSQVALKVLRPGVQVDAIEEFEIEGQLLTRLASASNVVDLHDSAEHVESVTMNTTGSSFDLVLRFHVLELADACLTELLVDLPSLAWEDRLDLYRGVIKGAHQSSLGQVLHRDYKSENVLLFAQGNSAMTKISDFGRGRLRTDPARLSPDHYMSGRGDRRFAPPELLFLLADPTVEGWLGVELYLLGSVLYETATGVGITSTAIPNVPAVLHKFSSMRPSKRQVGFERAVPALRARYEQAFLTFESCVPPSIRSDSVRLLRELCDPEPARRPILRSATSRPEGFEWILNRVDIMIRNLSYAQQEAADLAAKKHRRHQRKES